MDYASWKKDRLLFVEESLRRHAPSPSLDEDGSRLSEAMRHGALGGGKRVRALLAVAAAELGEPDPEGLSRIVAALEFVHAYSLVHDDLPCMDDDDLRRGEPSCHVKYGEATAVLAGDALQSLAFEILCHPRTTPGGRHALELVRELARAAGVRGMCMGQEIDQRAIGRSLDGDALERMHALKTGALIRASVRMGALGGGLDPDGGPEELGKLRTLDLFASHLGTAFQVVDDVLDAKGDPGSLGKTPGKDAQDNKPTFVTMLGLEEAERRAKRSTELAVEALGKLPDSGMLEPLAMDLLSRVR